MLRHSLDTNHIEKNICDDILETLMSINKKMNGTIQMKIDFERMRIKRNFHLQMEGNRVFMPCAYFRMKSDESLEFCKWL